MKNTEELSSVETKRYTGMRTIEVIIVLIFL